MHAHDAINTRCALWCQCMHCPVTVRQPLNMRHTSGHADKSGQAAHRSSEKNDEKCTKCAMTGGAVSQPAKIGGRPPTLDFLLAAGGLCRAV